jgi:hypothetical protein
MPILSLEITHTQRRNEVQELGFSCVVPANYYIDRLNGIEAGPILLEAAMAAEKDGVCNHNLERVRIVATLRPQSQEIVTFASACLLSRK